jgi:hypothetical protein
MKQIEIMKNMMGGTHTDETLPRAQAVKDATTY